MRTKLAAAVLVALSSSVPVMQAADTKPTSARPAAVAAPVAVAPAVAPAGAPSAAPVVPQTFPVNGPYAYKADGRRDPFTSLAGGGAESKALPKPTAAGIAGIRVDELSVRGVMQSRDRLVAMVQGSDSRTYLIHQGDKLADGAVKSITPQGLVLLQDIVDPRAKDKTREVHKPLRTSENEKE